MVECLDYSCHPMINNGIIRHNEEGAISNSMHSSSGIIFQKVPDMLVPPDMVAPQSKLIYQINKFCTERVQNRMVQLSKTIFEICKIVQDILREVEIQEPRFISSLAEYNGSDGRKRSMSLWVEFITASGYLSSRKIRSRFQTLVAQACDKSCYRDIVKLIADVSEVKLRIRERYTVQITPAFKCSGIWPRSASHWPLPGIPWPHPNIVADVKNEGFDLLSKECAALQGKNNAMEGDAWIMSFREAENRLLYGGCRKKCLSILKTLRDRHLDLPGEPITSYHMKTLLLYECEKHPQEMEWDETCLADRINGILLQMISCLQCRRCPHYFLPSLNLFKGKSPNSMENAAKEIWKLLREMLTNSYAFEKL
uniref:Uncharacterized protein n=2 Tax=Lutzomyia longipalpis TaxID=7200 RepID=A0A1B0C964_LUTLO